MVALKLGETTETEKNLILEGYGTIKANKGNILFKYKEYKSRELISSAQSKIRKELK